MNASNNRLLNIAIGNSRKVKAVKNQEWTWQKLVARMTTPERTAETFAEFMAMSKDLQSEIKDVGIFLGGYCTGGNRKEVQFRSLLCLDADFADEQLLQDLRSKEYAYIAHSTHKHTPENYRLRIIIPLSRNVTPEEYEPVGRWIASDLGMEKFDPTTFQYQRVMFWPSCSQDAEYTFAFQDGAFLNPDGILDKYHDWQDISSWTTNNHVSEIAHMRAAQQADPLTKEGLVGAFCRAYSIEEAIETFVPTYQPCRMPNRYTYTEGTTAAGVVTYDDKFSYSHHATDPASGQLCNAWDLVRLHRFKDLDANCYPETAPTSRPSYQAMTELAMEDKRVRTQLLNDKLSQADYDFGEEPANAEWKAGMACTKNGKLAQTIDNAVKILTHDPFLKGRIAYDEQTHCMVARDSLPWRKVKKISPWVDSDDSALQHYLERNYGLSSPDRIFTALDVVAHQAMFHPIKEYLEGCIWDGHPRVETLLVDYLGANDTQYTRAVTRKTLAAAVARIYEPGCKFDYMLTLRGKQGLGKSSFIRKLAVDWFSDSFPTMQQGKEAFEQATGVWLVEISELDSLKKAESTTVKMFLSKTSDRFRPAYGRRIQEFPRQCIFFGTTNEIQFLRDMTGNRRFWVVDTPNTPSKSVWADLTPETVKLIWAEAMTIYKSGEPLYLSEELEAVARRIQEGYEEENPKIGIIHDYLDCPLPENWEDKDTYDRRVWLENQRTTGTVKRRYVCTMEIWAEALGGNPEKFDRYIGREIREIILKNPEWRYMDGLTKTIKPYGRQRYFMRGEGTI